MNLTKISKQATVVNYISIVMAIVGLVISSQATVTLALIGLFLSGQVALVSKIEERVRRLSIVSDMLEDDNFSEAFDVSQETVDAVKLKHGLD